MKYFSVFCLVLALSGVWVAVLFLIHDNKKWSKVRKSPFNKLYLKPAGYSTKKMFEELHDKLMSYVILMMLMPSLAFTVHAAQIALFETKQSPGLVLFYAFLLISAEIYAGKKILSLKKKCKNYKLGYVAEQAIGQELQEFSRLLGAKVFHDFIEPNKKSKFNIDHIVVSKKGIFCLETKAISKPAAEEFKKEGSRLTYAEGKITLPTGTVVTKPLEQAQRNADHLQSYLLAKTGLNIVVHPVVAIPGWYIENKSRFNSIAVINGVNCVNFLCGAKSEVLTEKEISILANTLEEPCGGIDLEDM